MWIQSWISVNWFKAGNPVRRRQSRKRMKRQFFTGSFEDYTAHVSTLPQNGGSSLQNGDVRIQNMAALNFRMVVFFKMGLILNLKWRFIVKFMTKHEFLSGPRQFN